MAKLFRKGKVKKVVAIVLGLVSVAGAVFGVSALAKYAKEEQKVIHPTFSVGGLTETGLYEETDDKIYTKDAFEAKGLEIKLDFDSNVTYQVFWYDDLGNFSHCSEEMTTGMRFYAPYNHKARIEVTPIFDETLEEENAKISWYETLKYANQIEIRVDKNQKIAKSEYTKVDLSNPMWKKLDGKYIDTGNGEYVTAVGITSFEFTNSNGIYSSMYVEKYQLMSNDYALHIRLKDGTTYYYYSSTEENNMHPTFALEDDLPTYEKPMAIPKDATVYLWGYFGEAELTETILCFY